MKWHKKYAIAAIVLGVLLGLVPYIVVSLYAGDGMWSKLANSGVIRHPLGWHAYDDFDSKGLDSTWKFVDPQGGSSFDLGSRESWLKMTTTSPSMCNWTDGPRLMQSNATGNFTIATEVQSTTSSNGESAGLLVWKDSQNCLRLDRTRGKDNQEQILFEVKDGNCITCDLASSLDPIRLMLKRYANNFTGYYFNENGLPFQIGTIPFSMEDPLDTGLHVTFTHQGSFSAFFDYFDGNALLNSTDSMPGRYYPTSAMWITTPEMNPSLITPGYRFNATVWLKMDWDVKSYQLTLLFNSTQLKCIRADFTDSTSSTFMAGKGETARYVTIDGVPDHGNGSIVATESCNGNGRVYEYILGPHTGSLIWAEFEVTKMGKSLLSISPGSSETWVMDPDFNMSHFAVNNCTINLNR